MRKLLIYSFLIYLFIGLFLPIYIKGQDLPQFDVDNPDSGLIQDNPRSTITNIFQIVFRVLIWIALGFAVIFFAYAGILIIFKGDMSSGKNYIIYGIIGLVISLISWAVVSLVSRFVQTGQLGQ
ncbi:MAG: hypothetical protein KatS3mg094_290 [Candidatus Parcubacteria bacterium]|nr:MAG: hypothetical protein KatS3mg094_290 [Candidatus Parcubacteria bacterium]